MKEIKGRVFIIIPLVISLVGFIIKLVFELAPPPVNDNDISPISATIIAIIGINVVSCMIYGEDPDVPSLSKIKLLDFFTNINVSYHIFNVVLLSIVLFRFVFTLADKYLTIKIENNERD